MNKLILVLTVISIVSISCRHSMRITNPEELQVSSSYPLKNPIIIGITSNQVDDFNSRKYIEAIVDSLAKNSTVERVIYPYKESLHKGIVNYILDINVNPDYSGKGSNFFVNWPGFLIWAPAIWGYGYKVDINTSMVLTDLKKNDSSKIDFPMTVHFRHAEINRTWTEVSWFEVSIIALVGGVVFMYYDEKATPEFLNKFSPTFGQIITARVIRSVSEK